MHIFPPVHIVVACESQLVNYVEDALLAIRQKYGKDLPSAITTITGPSRTADIEKTLVLGAHGPKEIVVFIETVQKEHK
jgi:L-lactate dehydrogenase complex protein LldG